MFFSIMSKEIKAQLRNITFWLFIVLALSFYFTQYSPGSVLTKPVKDIEPSDMNPSPYGYTEVTDELDYMMQKTQYIKGILNDGWIVRYPIGFYNKKPLKIEEEELIKEFLMNVSDIEEKNNIENARITSFIVGRIEFNQLAKILGKELGGNPDFLNYTPRRSMMYEEALIEYESLMKDNNISSAYARLFCDYIAIDLVLFGIFITAFILWRDKRSRMQQVIFSKQVKGITYIFAKATGITALISIFIVLLSIYSGALLANQMSQPIMNSVFIFLKYTFAWLLPSVLAVTSLGLCIGAITKFPIVAIPINIIWWILSMMPLKGDYDFYKVLIRYNAKTTNIEYMQYNSEIIFNRVFISILSLAVLFITSYIWEYKRGRYNGK